MPPDHEQDIWYPRVTVVLTIQSSRTSKQINVRSRFLWDVRWFHMHGLSDRLMHWQLIFLVKVWLEQKYYAPKVCLKLSLNPWPSKHKWWTVHFMASDNCLHSCSSVEHGTSKFVSHRNDACHLHTVLKYCSSWWLYFCTIHWSVQKHEHFSVNYWSIKVDVRHTQQLQYCWWFQQWISPVDQTLFPNITEICE